MLLFVEQDVKFPWQSCSGLKNEKNLAQENVKYPGKRCFAVRKEWVKSNCLFGRDSKLFGRAGHFQYF